MHASPAPSLQKNFQTDENFFFRSFTGLASVGLARGHCLRASVLRPADLRTSATSAALVRWATRYYNFMKRILYIIVLCILFSCQRTTDVYVRTVPSEGYDTYYNSRYVGKSPVRFTASNYFEEKHLIEFKKSGETVHTETLKKELKPANILTFSLTLYLSLLWANGPSEQQLFYIKDDLTEAKNKSVSKKTETLKMPKADPEEKVNDILMKVFEKYKGEGKKSLVLATTESFEVSERALRKRRRILSMATEKAFQSGKFIIVEREHLDAVLKEKKLSLQGLLESKKEGSLWKFIDADLIMILNSQYEILECKLLDLKTGEIVSYSAGSL